MNVFASNILYDPGGGTGCNFTAAFVCPLRMKPYRIMSTLRLLLPQHRRLACHNTLTEAGREKQRERESAGSVKAILSVPVCSSELNSSHLQPLKQHLLHNTHHISPLTIQPSQLSGLFIESVYRWLTHFMSLCEPSSVSPFSSCSLAFSLFSFFFVALSF